MSRFVVLLALLLGAVAPAHAAPAHPRTVLAAVPIGRMDLPWWRHRFEEKRAELHRGRVDLVFYGDSITQDWERTGPQPWADFRPIWQHYYGGRHAVNLGFIGDTTASLIWRIDHGEASGISPKAAVVLIGANNMGRPHWSAPDTVDGIETVIRLLRRHLPHTKILLLAVLPSARSAWITRTTAAINRRLAEIYGQRPGGRGDLSRPDRAVPAGRAARPVAVPRSAPDPAGAAAAPDGRGAGAHGGGDGAGAGAAAGGPGAAADAGGYTVNCSAMIRSDRP